MDTQPSAPSLAEQEMTEAKHDPRLDRGREAMVADWRTAMRAAERTWKLGIWGLHELTMSLEREELARGFSRGQADAPADVAAALNAAWERAQLAQADHDNEAAELNAMTLVAMVSALDAMIEALVPGAQEMMLTLMVQSAEDEVTKTDPDAFSGMREEERAAHRATTVQALKSRLPKIDRLFEVGAVRWERVLKHAQLQAPPTRPVPDDLDAALAEIVSLRHVLTHRGGRVDDRALRAAPSLPYTDGQLVRLRHSDYRLYSAALYTYGEEVIYRLMRDLAPQVDLQAWRQNYTIGV